MDAISFDRLVRSLATRPSRRRVTRALSSLTLVGLVSQLPETPAGVAKKKKKVTLCHEGQTITVGKKKKKAHLKHGDTSGPCPPTTTTTTSTTTTLPPGPCAGGEGSPCGTDCTCAALAADPAQLVCVFSAGIGGEDCANACAGNKECVRDPNNQADTSCAAPCQ